MQRRNWITIAIFVGFVLVCLGLTRNDRPLLGLDLQGGVAVVLQPKGDPPTESVEQAKNIITQRVDALGVAEPDIVRQGKTIVVQLPGVKDRDKALSIIGRTAKLEFRPVLEAPAAGYVYNAKEVTAGANPCVAASSLDTSTTTTAPGATTVPGAGSSTVPATSATTTAPATSLPATTGGDQSGAPALGPPVGPADGESAMGPLPRQVAATTVPATTVPATTAPATSAPATSAPAATTTPATTTPGTTTPGTTTPTTTAPGADGSVVLPLKGSNQCLKLGPVGFEGKGLSSATAQLQTEWEVNVKIKGNTKSVANQLMNACFQGAANCPTKQSAIVLDGVVQSAPTVNAADLANSPQGFVITGNFTSGEAKDLALVLKYGALPVEFQKDVNVQEVSATLGKDSLHAGIVSGLVGLGLVVAYMLLYYRLLGLVAILSLLTGAGLLWAVIAHLGTTNGLALTLAGITGIIVSIGIAVDSNVVFYEHIREDIHKGRSFRSVVQGSFDSAWRTIIAADLVSLIAAALLYLLTVGAVRGFAFYLGLSTLLDLVASYFLMRPLVLILSRREGLTKRPWLLGLKLPDAPEGGAK